MKLTPVRTSLNSSMGVRRLFSRGGQNFPGGKNIIFALKMLNNILFSFKKVEKHTILTPADAHDQQGSTSANFFLRYFAWCLNFNKNIDVSRCN